MSEEDWHEEFWRLAIVEKFAELIQSPLCKQVNAALLYSELIDKEQRKIGQVDWTVINRLVVDKWSVSGLEKIKIMAWQLVEGSHLKL
jgi:hypothetical protein